ncbi:YiiX/YebB-like N1pC/P60 family cysteine hydrolase [Asticcacaulis sp. AC402]|uniref:YiiX/YebB-like N1pC/P60 family cysteine hydrolase n=1 Tax=Asticcacaulis sp. AC402 TaxID=1282361 RepID=UPI0004CEDD4C|nr:YiiX/YebB-like N1pC/P60 family cysteine hydrolase [Asticcacaulis sp. AC402]
MKRKPWIIGIVAIIALLATYAGLRMVGKPPALKDGDLIFQTSGSHQSAAILAATGSAFTHMGILERDDGQWYVVEAGGTVTRTPLGAWTRRGKGGRYAVYRRDLTPAQTRTLLKAAHRLDGRPYDIFFSFNNRAIYCSELPYLAFGKAGITIGQVQKVRDLHADNGLAKSLIEKRWRRHDDCKGLDFDACYARILDQDLVTPVSIANDRQFRQIFSNYPL